MAIRSTPHRIAVRRVTAAQIVSIAGTQAAEIALLYAVYQRTGSAAWVSAALLCSFGTLAVATPLAGSLGDKFDRRVVMVASDLAGAACFAALSLARSPSSLLALAFVAALTSSPFNAAADAAVPNLVLESDLAWANGTISFGRSIGFVVGPAAGGLLVAALGVPAVFLINAGSFVVSAGLVLTVRGSFAGARSEEEHHRGLRAGFRFIAGDATLRRMTLAFAVFTLAVGSVLVAELPLARSLGVGSIGYGLIATAFGVGALGGSLWARRLSAATEGPAIAYGSVATAVGFGAVSLLPSIAPIYGAMLASGASDGVVDVAALGILQRRAPDAVRSRVLSAFDGAVLGTFALSFLFAGAVVDALGPKAAYAIAGAGCAVCAAILWPLRRRHALEPSQ
jgi:MFS family permease